MKNYNQIKFGGYTLNHSIYRKIVNEIRCYEFYKRLVESIEKKSKIDIVEEDILHLHMAKERIKKIDTALKIWVNPDYQEAVLMHLAYGFNYYELEDLYYLSRHTLKKWTQRFVYGVAKEMGEDFKKESGRK